ncbi:DUF2075 domain-containing protein [Staphylococcus equorum]|uniref:DUF2075 domain-containing protein n=1 Tax=Staphylococcus equorum TaxID=246432 RepID=UPI00209C913B|nr:DUF2075 domain-containing protein [Staphylococcus equorum]
MGKYDAFELDIKEGQITNLDKLNNKKKKLIENGNIIYIYLSNKPKKKYIGQTKHFLKRHKQHFNGNEEKFNEANFNKVIILTSQYFHLSALNDVEKQLITYFAADLSKNQKLNYDDDEVINLTNGNAVIDYIEKEKVETEVILPFWENELYPLWVNTPTINKLKSNVLVKYSPIKTLTMEQSNLISKIVNKPHEDFVINGDAGTGKTVLLTHIVAELLENTNKRVAIVVQPNWIDTAANIFKVYNLKNDNLKITTSTSLINNYLSEKEMFDVVIVDESHKMSRRYSKQHPTFNKVYQNQFEETENHLECIKQIGKQIILMYDVLQGIRPANIQRSKFMDETKNFQKEYLTTQFRIQAPEGKNYNSDDYINGIKYLLYKDTGLLDMTNFNSDFDRDLFRDKSEDAYFGYFENKPLNSLIEWLDDDLNYNHNHVNRVLGGLVEPWKQAHGKDPSITHWHEDGIKRRWNSKQENWINSSDEDAKEQIGSVFAVQGIDLNKVGVLVGNDLQVDANGKLYGETKNFYNVNGVFPKDDFTPENEFEFTIFVLNIYYVLLTRGIDGIRIGFWKNEKFKNYMKKTLDIN